MLCWSDCQTSIAKMCTYFATTGKRETIPLCEKVPSRYSWIGRIATSLKLHIGVAVIGPQREVLGGGRGAGAGPSEGVPVCVRARPLPAPPGSVLCLTSLAG
eukprot:EG_transcript_29283